jgi:hypothetical protein
MDLITRRLARAQTTRGPVSVILGTIIPMPLSDRKTLLTICRVQEDPSTHPSLVPIWSTIYYKKYFYEGSQHIPRGWYQVDGLSYWFQDRFTDPVWMGFLSMLLRTLPVTDDEAKEAFQESFEKEFQATQQIPRPTQLNYSFLHSPSLSDIHPTRSILPEIYQLLHQGIQEFRNRVSGTLLLPRSSKKSTSLSTKYEYAKKMKCLDLLNEHITLQDLERMYSRGEGLVDGTVEMRQAWKYNDLKPRTYFACGGTMYYPSRYIQPVMNALVDSFPSTDTYGRFSIERFSQLSTDELVIIYDYTSFTSSMSEQKHFLAELANAMRGTSVTVIDTLHGPTQQDLGCILEEYNSSCNYEGEFTMSDRLGLEGVYRHICASFLGVYGNISSCTALHGISLVALLTNLDGASVIGDDAMARFMKGNLSLEEFHAGVITLGSVHESKYKVFHEEFIENEGTFPVSWHYAKRPVKRLAGKMFQGRLVDWPLLPYLITSGQRATSYHTVKDFSKQKNMKVFCMQAGRLLDQIREVDLDPETEDLIRCYLEIGYCVWGLDFSGSVGHYVSKHSCWALAYPCIDGTMSFDEDWVDFIAHKCFGDSVELPVLFDPYVDRAGFGVENWETGLTPLLSLGKTMGWISAEPIFEKVILSEGTVDRYVEYLRRRPMGLYRLCVLNDVPTWFALMYSLCVDR